MTCTKVGPIEQRRAKLERLRKEVAQIRAGLPGTPADEQQARHESLHDSLTSLPNRSYFLQRLTTALARPPVREQSIAILHLDLDAFKVINEAHGEAAGDEVLTIVGARLSNAIRADDTVSRLESDEFACLLEASRNWKQLGSTARKLIAVVSAPLKIDSVQLSVRPSIGIAMCPGDGKTASELLTSADYALYRAKRNRSGFAFVDRIPEHARLLYAR